ncbi:PD-(D/E)XK nuclease superfamily protein [Halanaerobium saccharolyticum]|uniref:PD-(D/E)XK nuclease superfamily protein n=1 Tax=Halanaerobium saccharolyticum TaxID=43595 RepID=A0A4R7Z896_9FIRM|nr:AAA family ATPase [Halanaerobium saccharolyticum]RAK09790.1 PD-(D/E)XK nuclease superfamily protein [Halanaerobium saccharolyticum]TDW07352.1 PD-(D/E)XK nuclease superfamily protein [Halanaerobium saccharolyticum]TDX61231.1 PD-(D/E)XK nuclease superfamily protein [Halanaerobium saccharolyticum]
MAEVLKGIPLGIDNFKELLDKNAYFVDKSLFVKEVINNTSKIMLFTRPRRFGKSLNFSMLKCFLEKPECRKFDNQDQSYKYLFKKLDIASEEELLAEHQGRYPLLNFSFKKIKANNWQEAAYLLKEEIAREYKRHRYLLDSNLLTDFEKDEYQKLMRKEAQIFNYSSAIKELTDYLKRYFNEKSIVLIDEYDTPLHYAKLNGYYDEMLNFMRALMIDGLKGNDSLEKGVVTGIMKISQESIFSAFNNPETNTIIDSFCADKFGFTEAEVKEMLAYYSISDQLDIVRDWYNGYLFGDRVVIYNPWSILNFVKSNPQQPQTYWNNTGDPGLIKEALQLDQKKGKEYLEKLYQGQSLEVEVDSNIIYDYVFNDVDKALSFLLHSGYLKAEKKGQAYPKYSLSIPNREIRLIFKNILANWFNFEEQSGDLIVDMLNSLIKGDLSSFEIHLQDLILVSSSYYDAAASTRVLSEIGQEKEKQENFYHGLILGLMTYLSDKYYLESNKEYGLGRADVVLLPKDTDQDAFVMEFKNEYTTSDISAAAAAEKALQQINEQKYAEALKKQGLKKVYKLGIGFKGKELALKTEIE